MDLPRIAATVSRARQDLDEWGTVVGDLRSAPKGTFSDKEIDMIEGEYTEKNEIEKEATNLLRQHLDKASEETETLEKRITSREQFMSQHATTLTQTPELWESMKQETENFKVLIESIRTLLGSA